MLLKIRIFLYNLLLFAALSLASEHRAYAYADAGTGLLVLQSLGAMFSGLLFFLRKQIKASFLKKPRRP